MSKNILIINGSYRDDGITDQTTKVINDFLTNAGANVDTIMLRNNDFRFCLNCRECMQENGPDPKPCVQEDAMGDIIKKLENADAFVLASPTNLGSVTALFKRFMERLSVYAFWPWGAKAPQYRKESLPKNRRKKALLITSSAIPGFIARWVFSTTRQLKQTARIIGADAVGIINNGMAAEKPNKVLDKNDIQKIKKQADKLLG